MECSHSTRYGLFCFFLIPGYSIRRKFPSHGYRGRVSWLPDSKRIDSNGEHLVCSNVQRLVALHLTSPGQF